MIMEERRKAENLKVQTSILNERLTDSESDMNNSTAPYLIPMRKDIKFAIETQKNENSKLQSEITKLKMDRNLIQELIIASIDKLARLEAQIGSYREENNLEEK